MKVCKLIILLAALPFGSLLSQNLEELRSMNARAKVQYVKPDVLDRLMNGIRLYETNPVPGQDSLLYDTYRTIAQEYVANNHYKQAYSVYRRYLAYKEGALADKRKKTIEEAYNTIALSNRAMDTEKEKLESELFTLQSQNKNLDDKRLSFKRNFSFALILLSAAFAIMLLSAGLKAINYRAKLKKTKERMKEIHRNATTGFLAPGIKSETEKNLLLIKEQSNDLLSSFKSHKSFPPAAQASQILEKTGNLLHKGKVSTE